MIFIILIVIATMLLFCKNDNTPNFFGGGSKKHKKIHIVNLNKEKSVELLAYMAVEYAITERHMNREMLEDSSYLFLDTLIKNMKKSKVIIKKAREKVSTLLESIPRHEKLGKPLIIRKLVGFHGVQVLVGEIDDMKKKILPDSNVLQSNKPYNNILKKKFVGTTHLICDSSKNKILKSIKILDSSGVYKIYIDGEFLLSYKCTKRDSSYSFLKFKNEGTSTGASSQYEKCAISKLKNSHKKNLAFIELYMSKAVKDLGIIISSLVNDLLFMTHDAWAMMVANRIFNVPVLYSRPSHPDEYYYYSKRKINGFRLV